MSAAGPSQGAHCAPSGGSAAAPAASVGAQHPSAILVVRPSSLGDIVHALTLVADVRTHRPELAIDWVAETGFVPLVELHPGIRRIVPVALRHWRHQPPRRVDLA